MTIGRLLRVVAVAIAIAGLADPVLTREMPVREPLAIVMTSQAGLASAQRLKALLNDDYDVSAYSADEFGRSAACPAEGGCVVIATGRMPGRLSAGATVIGGIALADDSDQVRIVAVEGPAVVHVAATASLRVQLRGTAPQIDVFDDNTLVGSAPVSDKATEAVVEWVPLATGPRRLTVRAGTATARVGVVVADVKTPVVFYEPEATWLGTFVRRALTDDVRFAVAGRTRIAPPVAVTRGMVGPLDREAISRVGVVVVAAPHALSASESDLLARFVRVRGGSVVLLPDRAPAGEVMRLLPPITSTRREREPIAIGPLRGAEIVVFDATTPAMSVIASEGGRAIVVAQAVGRGRIVASGALDAWRYRGDGKNFTDFWTSIVFDAAAAAGNTVNISIESPLVDVRAGGTFKVEWRSMDTVPLAASASGGLNCGGRQSFVRLWPGARPGTYDGRIAADATGACDLSVSIAGAPQAGRTQLLLLGADDVASPSVPGHGPLGSPVEERAALAAAVAAHGGTLLDVGKEPELAANVRDRLPARRAPQPYRPMHSIWWWVPFTACLGGEWWLRRRTGLR